MITARTKWKVGWGAFFLAVASLAVEIMLQAFAPADCVYLYAVILPAVFSLSALVYIWSMWHMPKGL